MLNCAEMNNMMPSCYDMGIKQYTRSPMTTGTSVLGLCFDGGVVIVSDVLGSYGSLARFRECSRVMKVNKNIILGASGDYADFQYLQDIIKQKVIDEDCVDDGYVMKPKSLHCWLTRVLYNRRSKLDPFWNTFVIGGLQDGEPFLGCVDKLGTAYLDKQVTCGFGMHIATPLLRSELEKNPNMTKDYAQKLLVKCLEILFYRDARAFSKYEMITITADGVEKRGPLELATNWDVAHMVKEGYE